ncbi:hypothetical protein N8865_01510, partial [Francisellaceae bacterium]|nr:hypothetical protein [Francisellaceae bacterium]
MLKSIYQYFKQILVGKVCLACCQSNNTSSGLCKICEHSIYPYAISGGCQYCGHPILGHSETKICARCHEGDKKWDQLTIC